MKPKKEIPKKMVVTAFECEFCGSKNAGIPTLFIGAMQYVQCGTCLSQYPAVYAKNVRYIKSWFGGIDLELNPTRKWTRK